MKIKTVSFSQSVETVWGYGLKKWTKAASEIEFDEENDNPDNAYALAKQLVKEQITKEIAEHTEMKGTQVIDIEETGGKDGQLRSFIEAINTTTSLKSLEIFKKLVDRENNPQLTEAYDNKLKTFQ